MKNTGQDENENFRSRSGHWRRKICIWKLKKCNLHVGQSLSDGKVTLYLLSAKTLMITPHILPFNYFSI